ncbi:MAG TPA: peptide ABC transporter substrate-binding protein [Lachnospiraceae bacterium]|nr:peptide ABC transporter substrate-binding protein [Lachnospiraceae bacterium]
MSEYLIETEDLTVQFRKKNRKKLSLKTEYFSAVDHVGFSIKKGETYGLVGESGSGKSTVGKAILRYHRPQTGKILYDGNDIAHLGEKELLPYRKKMQSVFQDPYASLDPGMTVSEIICEPMEIHRLYTRAERKDRAAELIETVGLTKQDLLKYPHEFSGGQRQRISIARALSIHPEFVLCDEPISALDVSLQAQIVNMLEELQDKMGLTYLFISHQLQVVQKICDHIGVMYLGQILETGASGQVYENPGHPYTQMLLASMLEPDPDVHSLDGIIPDTGVQSYEGCGCKFAGRCPYVTERCREKMPEAYEAEPGHLVMCYRYER